MYFDESKIDKNEVIVNAVSSTLNISRNRTNTFSDHSRTIINFHKYGIIDIIDLDIDITMKNKAGIAYDQVTAIYVESAVIKMRLIVEFGIELILSKIKESVLKPLLI